LRRVRAGRSYSRHPHRRSTEARRRSSQAFTRSDLGREPPSCARLAAALSGHRAQPRQPQAQRVQFLAKKNAENRANMAATMTGGREALVNRLLRGFSGAKVTTTKNGSFRAADGASPYVAATFKNDAGARRWLQRGALPRALAGSRPRVHTTRPLP
jgi:hypothetical protein